jgi:plasmid maintenance system killer protein
LREIFAVLCDDLAQHLKHETNTNIIARELCNRLYQWSLLFEKAASQGLSPEEQRGLFGELIILKMLLENTTDPLPVLNSWQGVSGGIQDFFFSDRAIEVKTTFDNRHQTVTISNAAQLDESKLSFLWLAHLALENATSENYSLSLNDAVDIIFNLVGTNTESTTRFWAKLAEAGYFEPQRPLYEQPAYHIRATSFYQVRDEFPRIRPHELRSGVDTIKYTIRLSDCQTLLEEASFVLQNLPILTHE